MKMLQTRQARSVEAILQRAATLGSAAAVVVSWEGEVIYRGARGVTRRWDAAEGNATAPLPTRQPAHPVTADTRFDLASVTKIDFADETEAVPAFATIVMIVFTYNIANGLTAGLILHPLFKAATGRWRNICSSSARRLATACSRPSGTRTARRFACCFATAPMWTRTARPARRRCSGRSPGASSVPRRSCWRLGPTLTSVIPGAIPRCT